jgi:UDPglucose 6-dehydrogenase
MKIAVVGLGYVGLVTAACLARMGQMVAGLESDERKVRALAAGRTPFYEPGLHGALAEGAERLRFTSDPEEALAGADAILVCVGTPSTTNGEADLSAVMRVGDTIARTLDHAAVVALRSTVPIGTTERLEERINEQRRKSGVEPISVIANPEFLRTGRAIDDFLRPARVVLGRTASATGSAVELLAALYRPLEAPIMVLDARSAELVKNAANTYLATRISFVNELAALCDVTGASIAAVIEGIAADPRIGGDYLRPGLGYGGSCLPKDVRSIIAQGAAHDERMPLARAVDEVNEIQAERLASRLSDALGGSVADRRIALLGLAFKPDTDDVRESPPLRLAKHLHERGAIVLGCDPQAASALGEVPWLEIAETPASAARGADALVLATEWPAYVTADYGALAREMRGSIVLDARNALDPDRIRAAGLSYVAFGEPMEGSPGPLRVDTAPAS